MGGGPEGAGVREDEPGDAPMSASRSAAGLDALFATGVVGMISGRGGRVLRANAEFLRIAQMGADDVEAGVDFLTITPADHLERGAAAAQELQERGSAIVVKDVLRPDGTRVPCFTALAAVGPEPDGWVGVVVDLSSGAHLRRLARFEGALASSLLEDAPIGFALLDTELTFLRVNREMAAMNGFRREAHVGRHVFDLLPDLRESAEPLLRSVLETGEPLRDVEVVGATPADPGHEHTWLESFYPVRTPDGQVLGVAAVARDETRVRRLQEQVHATLDRQREALVRLQESLLPPVAASYGDVRVAARYLSAADDLRLGGDWYDVVRAPDGRLVLTVGDVTGHGLDAVGMMARTASAARAFVSDGASPVGVVHRLNRLLCSPDSLGLATVVVVALEPATGRLEYAVAGHPPPVVLRADGTARLLRAAGGPLLGGDDGAVYTPAQGRLAPGEALVLFTDGLVERRGESVERGLERLVGALAGTAPGTPPAAVVDRALARCLDGQPRGDDVCLLAAAQALRG